jgi:hypothetical protein
MYVVYAWNLFVWRIERIAVLLVYVKNVGTWAQKAPDTDSSGTIFLFSKIHDTLSVVLDKIFFATLRREKSLALVCKISCVLVIFATLKIFGSTVYNATPFM